MFEKLAAVLKKSKKTTQDSQTSASKTESKQQPKTIDPKHIGDLGEFKIEVQLRQFSKENRYLNDLLIANPRSKTGYTQIDHVLITPYAVFVIETKNYKGYVKGKREDRNWRVNGKFNMYNPVRQNRTHINALKRLLKDYEDIRFISIVSFTKRCELHIEPELRTVDTDEFVVYDILLTEFIERKLIRLKNEYSRPPLSDADVSHIFQLLGEKNITDSKAREEHVQKASAVQKTN
ncbi:nuclease-related domain-containing protein [Alicyclobacillus fodiniaquatilis]|uniref:Nuclease-related domain-containing protein n=1 Tax=Alicyclobacillus fodiniaquatilis TaxID=1661150 RepID=A0ABW4JIW7_9BACL